MRVHLVGIGGAGMSALANLYLARGDSVTGSDSNPSPVTLAAATAGAVVHAGHGVEAFGETPPDLVVASTAIHANNPELVEARRLGIPVISRGRAAADLVAGRRQIAVAGTHGKTTITTMVAHVLEPTDPIVLSGGQLPGSVHNSRPGAGPFAVVEADESDGSFLDLRPEIAVVSNIETDHLDRYPDLDAIRRAFERFVDRTSSTLVACVDDPGARSLLAVAPMDTISYGFDASAEVQGRDYAADQGGSTFALVSPWGNADLILPVPGRHNALNALAATAVAVQAGRALADVVAALAQVALPGRRLELAVELGGARVFDDYGHHPTEVAATLRAAREIGDGKLVVAFQPHMYTRLRSFMAAFADSLCLADDVLLLPVYAARDEPIDGVDAEALGAAIQARDGAPPVAVVASVDALADELPRHLGDGDVAVVMGAGDIIKATRTLRERSRAAKETG